MPRLAAVGVVLVLVAMACGGDAAPTTSTTAAPASTSTTSPPEAPAPTSSLESGPVTTDAPPPATDDPCAHVVAAEAVPTGDTYRVVATVRSADTGWDKYADAWEVRTVDGDVLGTRVLLHPHENEQPFTRSLDAVAIPAGETRVVVAARDSVAGFCGETVTVAVPGR
jgi:hypothetical protein